MSLTTVAWMVALVSLYFFYISGLSHNPPGFYLDESAIAYNAYLIAHTGKSEFGISFPLFFQLYTGKFVQYASPIQIYLLALFYLFFPASILATRIFAASLVFLAILLLGLLAERISGRRIVGIIVALTAILTPWLFETSRLVLETFFYPLALVLFLFALHRAYKHDGWTLFDIALLATSLAALTYSYTIGRLLGPLWALGLLLFADNKKRLIDIFTTWTAYFLTLLPLLVFYVRFPGVLGRRFNELTYITPDKTLWQVSTEFIRYYYEDTSLRFLLFVGDPLLRHHIQGTGVILAATLILAIAGIFVVLARHRKDPWWQFILFGLIVSPLPAALTNQRHHTLRMIAFPIFLLLMTVPSLMWLLDTDKIKPAKRKRRLHHARRTSSSRLHFNMFTAKWIRNQLERRPVRRTILFLLLGLTLLQAALFQAQFRREGIDRGRVFDAAYPRVLAQALASPARPIYLEDGYWGPAYIHAYWYATLQRVDTSQFVHLSPGAHAPAGSLVISSERNCSNCEIVARSGLYILYRTF